MKTLVLISLVVLSCSGVFGQLRITHVEQLALDESGQWSVPRFSPDGRNIYFSTFDYQGIWEYSLDRKTQRLITNDPRSGYGFCISPDGKKIAYRRTLNETNASDRIQEIVVKDLSSNSVEVLSRGSNLSVPVFSGSVAVYSDGNVAKNLTSITIPSKPVVAGIEDTKIALIINSKKILFDPLGKGSYIWTVLSPDGKKIVATDMARGAFVAGLNGNVLARLGKRNAAVWTRDGNWLVYMNDKDDGENILSSDLFCVSADGRKTRQLTFTTNMVELYPDCSPAENKIVCSTLTGKIILLTYGEVR